MFGGVSRADANANDRPSGAHTGLDSYLPPNVALVAVLRVRSRSQIAGAGSNRSMATWRPSGEIARLTYAPGGPAVPEAVPSRAVQVSGVISRRPDQYTIEPVD